MTLFSIQAVWRREIEGLTLDSSCYKLSKALKKHM